MNTLLNEGTESIFSVVSSSERANKFLFIIIIIIYIFHFEENT